MFMEKEIDYRLDDVARHWDNLIPIMVAEETGELLKCISKYERFRAKVSDLTYDDRLGYEDGRLNEEESEIMTNIEKEVADVMIIIGAMLRHYGLDEVAINQYVKEKLNKTYD